MKVARTVLLGDFSVSLFSIFSFYNKNGFNMANKKKLRFI